jgi:porin
MVSAMACGSPAWAQDVKVGASYVTDVLTVLDGGVDPGTAWLGRADVTVEIDGRAIGLDGVTFFGDLIYTHGPDFSGERVGDAQVVSNVQGDGILRPFEAWASVPLAGGASVKAGLIDLNTEFDIQSIGAFFINSSHGIAPELSQTGISGPSIFPVTSTAVMLKLERKGWSGRVGLFNGVAGDPDCARCVRLPYPGQDGPLVIAELDVSIGDLEVQLGGWRDGSRAETVASQAAGVPVLARGGHGGYVQLEGRLAGNEDGPRLDAWGRLGFADGETLRIENYVGFGATYGTDPSRMGIAVAHARQSSFARAAFGAQGPQTRAETVVELGYAVQLIDEVMLQPTVQYVVNPGWRSDIANAWVAGLRFAFALGG